MPTFAEWEAMRKGGAPAPSAPARPTTISPEAAAAYPTDESDPEGKLLSLTQDPARYLGHAAKGLVKSPIDLVKGLLGLPAQVVKGLTEDLPTLIKNPSLLAPSNIGRAASDTAEFANTHPDEMGSLLGQSLIGPRVPGAANAALREGPTMVGKGMSAVGRGAEAAGKIGAKTMKKGIVPLVTAATGHPWATAAEIAVPPILEAGGRAMQRGGAALDGLDLSLKGRAPFAGAPGAPGKYDAEGVEAPEGFTPKSKGTKTHGGQQMPELSMDDVALARETMGKAEEALPDYYPNQNAFREGAKNNAIKIVGGKSKQSQSVLRGLMDAAEKGKAAKAAAEAGDNAWANDASADPNFNNGEGDPMMAGTTPYPHAVESNAFSGERPIDTFLRNDPAARVGGEGRMTGQFDEGRFGLNNIANNTPHPTLDGLDSRITGLAPEDNPANMSPLDELARLSGRAPDAAAAQRLLDKLGGKGR